MKIKYDPRATLASLPAAIVMAAVILLIPSIHVVLRILIGGAIYIGCLILFGGISKPLLKEILQGRKNPVITPEA